MPGSLVSAGVSYEKVFQHGRIYSSVMFGLFFGVPYLEVARLCPFFKSVKHHPLDHLVTKDCLSKGRLSLSLYLSVSPKIVNFLHNVIFGKDIESCVSSESTLRMRHCYTATHSSGGMAERWQKVLPCSSKHQHSLFTPSGC